MTEQTQVKRIKITKQTDDQTSHYTWYNTAIGMEYRILSERGSDYLVSNSGLPYYVRKDDCVVLDPAPAATGEDAVIQSLIVKWGWMEQNTMLRIIDDIRAAIAPLVRQAEMADELAKLLKEAQPILLQHGYTVTDVLARYEQTKGK